MTPTDLKAIQALLLAAEEIVTSRMLFGTAQEEIGALLDKLLTLVTTLLIRSEMRLDK